MGLGLWHSDTFLSVRGVLGMLWARVVVPGDCFGVGACVRLLAGFAYRPVRLSWWSCMISMRFSCSSCQILQLLLVPDVSFLTPKPAGGF